MLRSRSLTHAVSRSSAGWTASLLALTLSACDRPPSADSLSEWTPADHHSNDDNTSAHAPASPAGPERPSDVAQLVDITWRQQCANCHGAGGRGDGQMGPMVGAPDLTNASWQSAVADADILAIIKNGKNRMPKFDLPDPVLRGLVQRIRQLRQQ